jgi:LmbE family N-acetylglucosaminyl deacetylase
MVRPRFVLAGLLAIAVLASTATTSTQVRPVYSQGVAGVLQAIQRLQTTAGALHVASHPDDEDTAFIARTARGDHARVAYLSLNRGEGGQNVIGPELFEALGVIRTEELLQARALDGGEQFFTRTYDFGFSKRLEEAAAFWGEDEVLRDMVRVIREFRPVVVYSGFSGTPADGHGQHQLAGRLTPQAFRAAADPRAFPEQLAEGLRPWQAKKLYVRQGFRPDPSVPATTRVQTGVFDPLLGRTYFEIAMEGRSQHKSQEMGVAELRGAQASALRLLESLVPAKPGETSVFDGLDTSVRGIAVSVGLPPGTLRAELEAMAGAAERALAGLDPRSPAGVLPVLADGLKAARAAHRAAASVAGPDAARKDAEFLLAIKVRQFEDAMVRAAGVVLDPLSTAETVVAGEAFGVDARLFVPNPAAVTLDRIGVDAPEGWKVAKGEVGTSGGESPMTRFFRETPDASERFQVVVPADAPPSQPYWLRQPRDGRLFVWPDGSPKARPFAPPLLHAEADVRIAGVPVTLRAPVHFRLVDQVRGELRRQVAVIPAIAIALDSDLQIVPVDTLGHPRPLVVRVASGREETTQGTVRLTAPDGWRVEPAEAPFAFTGKGQRTAVTFTVTPVAGTREGRYAIGAVATAGGQRYDVAMRTIAYPHIQTHRLYSAAVGQVRVLDLKVAPVRVGYIMGSGDQVPDAIRRMGLQVELLDEETLAAGDFSRFDVIVVGIRASEARPDFVASNGRLLDFVRRGGTLIVQYQQPDYAARNLPPYPVEYASRVTDETAPVTILQPQHPVFTTPNRIGPADWEGWVQERNLYAFSAFDDRYLPLLETADAGEPPQRGGEVYAEIGNGRYVYTAYAWFRQLPAGVPGAYRMFANLLSLGARRQ